MKKITFILVFALFLNATTLKELFIALKNHSQTKLDIMQIEKAKISKDIINSKLFPEINGFISYDHYSMPTALRPLPPTEVAQIGKNKGAYPFSKDIKRVGIELKMPLLVKSIYTLIDKAKLLQKSAIIKQKLNLIQNEALLVSLDANLIYLKKLKNSLNLKEKSILETKKTIIIKVNNGRAPKSALYKVNDALNQIQIAKNNIELKKYEILSKIKALTGIKLNEAIPLKQISNINEEDFKILKPLFYKVEAKKIELKASKEELYPSVLLHANYTKSYASAYNNDKSLDESYSDIGLIVKIPITGFDKRKNIQKAKILLQKEKINLQILKDELIAKAQMLKKTLKILDKSIELNKKSVENKIKLLQIAKVNYQNTRLSTEEYLRYEDEVVSAKAKLFENLAKRWQILMSLAVIYGNEIEELVN